ncbi:MAG: DsrE/DsrF/DrsH-like family protein [Bifidobacterium bifidum]
MKRATDHGVRLVACQMSMDIMGIHQEELIDGVELGGVSTFLGSGETSDMKPVRPPDGTRRRGQPTVAIGVRRVEYGRRGPCGAQTRPRFGYRHRRHTGNRVCARKRTGRG